MDRLFLDANVLFSAAYRPSAGVCKLWQLTEVELTTSAYAAEEAYRNLDPRKHSELDNLLRSVKVLTAAPPDRPLKSASDLPEKDRPILLSAVNAKATHLITGDYQHFAKYYGKTIEGVVIMSPGDYLLKR